MGDASASITGGLVVDMLNSTAYQCEISPLIRGSAGAIENLHELSEDTSTDLPSKIDTVAQKLWRGEIRMLVEPRPTACLLRAFTTT